MIGVGTDLIEIERVRRALVRYARFRERCFTDLDGPVRVLGSLDTPVPYAPSLEDAFLLSEQRILDEARALAAY